MEKKATESPVIVKPYILNRKYNLFVLIEQTGIDRLPLYSRLAKNDKKYFLSISYFAFSSEGDAFAWLPVDRSYSFTLSFTYS